MLCGIRSGFQVIREGKQSFRSLILRPQQARIQARSNCLGTHIVCGVGAIG